MKNVAKKGLAIGFIFFILLLAITNHDSLCSAFDGLDKKAPFSKKVSSIHDTYVKNVKWKNTFVNLNGAFMRWTGQRVCNKVARLKNGMLSRVDYSKPDPRLETTISTTIELKNEIERMGIPFLYINLAGKMNLHHELLPAGFTCFANAETDSFLKALGDAGVKTFDARVCFSNSSVDFEKYFYATDHHWNALGALKAAPRIVQAIEDVLAVPHQDLTRLDPAQWECHVKKNWWLGSEGKRTGRYYGGLDDLIYLTPKFEMETTVMIPHKNIFRKGDFETANLVMKYAQEKHDLYSTNSYRLHIGGDHPLVHSLTPQAPISQKVLIVKDSYLNPLIGFLSSIFQQLDVIDMRYFLDSSLLEYIAQTQPDLVVMMLSHSQRHHIISKSKKRANESIGPWKAKQEVYTQSEFVVKMSPQKKYNYHAVDYPLAPGKTYSLDIEKVDILEGKTEGLSIALFDPVKNVAEMREFFDIEEGNAQGGFHRMFKVPSKGTIQLIIYSGVAGAAQGISVKCTNLRLTECVE